MSRQSAAASSARDGAAHAPLVHKEVDKSAHVAIKLNRAQRRHLVTCRALPNTLLEPTREVFGALDEELVVVGRAQRRFRRAECFHETRREKDPKLIGRLVHLARRNI